MNIDQEYIKEESVDIKTLIFRFLNYWYFFPVSIFVALCIAYFINKFTIPVYQVGTTILVQSDKSLLDPASALGIGISNNQYTIQNEIAIIKTLPLTRRAIKKLPFQVSYFENENFYQHELYKSSPFRIVFDSTFPQIVNVEFKLKFLSDSTFEIQAQSPKAECYSFLSSRVINLVDDFKISRVEKLGKEINGEFFKFRIEINKGKGDLLKEKEYCFVFMDQMDLTAQYHSFEVQDAKMSTVIKLSMKGNNVEKITDFLNQLTEEYLKRSVEKKNTIASNTIDFIDNQLGEVTDSLAYSEKELQNFRSSNKLMDLDFQSQKIFENLGDLQNKKAELLLNSKYYKYLQGYFQKNTDVQDIIAPSAIGITDPLLSNLIIELADLYNEKNEAAFNSKKDNPYISSIDRKIVTLKKTLLENISNILKNSDISLKEIDDRISDITVNIEKLPKTQRELIGYERKYKMNDALYTFLITKRSEVQIDRASYIPNNEIIEPASADNQVPISPKKSMNYLIALILGLGLPIVFIMLKDYFDDSIATTDDIEKITGFPILGYIIRNRLKTQTIVYEQPKSLIAESFRSIRTNMQFVANENEKHIVLITSSTMSEGKSFTALNLATSFSVYNKKVIILSFDLRKPTIHSYFGLRNNEGLSTYLSGNCTLENTITPSPYPHLDLIFSGPIPPNPVELIASSRTAEMFEKLKEEYDYIFIDTPPIGLVSDALLFLKYSDVNLFLIRHNVTRKRMLRAVFSSIEKIKLSNLNIVVNDIKAGNNYGYVKGYGYNYAYGYSYDDASPEERWIHKLFKSRKKIA
jgi:tyrosine-protein kinase Etk/Wzc